jgi:hypothetical protein
MAEPYCLALVLCDAVHRDPLTGKFTLLGTFDSFMAPSFPAQLSLFVYFAVTDGLGSCTLRIQVVDGKAGPIDAAHEGDTPGRIVGIKTDIEFPSPLVVLEHAIGIQTRIPDPGVYLCELWANETMLMSRRLIARSPDDLEKGDENE